MAAVIERSQQFGIPLKPGQSLGIGGKLLGQDFQRHVPVQLGIGGTVDLAHPTLAYQFQDFVMANGGTDYGAIPLVMLLKVP